MRRHRFLARLALLAAAASAAGTAAGEIYRWTDAEGRVHFTEDLSRVPADQRGSARQGAAAPAPSRVQTYETPPAARAAARSGRTLGARSGRAHQVRVERAGNAMVVPVRLNGRTVAPFLLDTGASYVLVPARVAQEAGIDVGPGTRTLPFTTANGIVEQPVVTLDSVELGTARAEQVAAAISDRVEIGLLGLSFFNRFTYQIDAAAGVVTLVENDLAESGQIVGGRSEVQWRNEFQALRARIAEVGAARSRTTSAHGRRLDRLDGEEAALERQLQELDAEADQANVPHEWRH
ncbi:MAG TPA: TIGR02281 family clan AA aspartic protease [Myxococcota bacterium]|nr:TIGR02281 family clan AA aspartic protease [Myxococcota bacterium]